MEIVPSAKRALERRRVLPEFSDMARISITTALSIVVILTKATAQRRSIRDFCSMGAGHTERLPAPRSPLLYTFARGTEFLLIKQFSCLEGLC
jgi:hypothetical protein